MARSIRQSQHWLERAKARIPTQTQTLSKGPTQFVQGVCPVFIQRGKGSHIWDVDGNEYIDYMLALGPITLGWAYPATDDAVRRQLEQGITFSLPHPLEVELAELLGKTVPCAEMVRYAKNGSDATAACVRIARAYTKRDLIAVCGYHGAQDWYLATTERDHGVPALMKELVRKFDYNKIETLEKIFADNPSKVAAVIMEAIGVEEPRDNFLQRVRELCTKHGALLIFDEIVTGFRVALGGAQQHYNVIPDLAAFGKGAANGMPLSIVAGKKEIMRTCEDVFFSMTYGGETLSLAAAIATINEMRAKPVIEHLWRLGAQLKDGFNALATKYGIPADCKGLPPHAAFTFKDKDGKDDLLLKSLFVQEVSLRGILVSGGYFINYSHTDHDIAATLAAFEEAFILMRKALDEGDLRKYLKGTPVQPVFRKP
jgi:glutamate-1-semialdehyde 2,1-aminomutase/spore coat polysaccharide biosynthesis protein SpsF